MSRYVKAKLSNFPAKVHEEFINEHGAERVRVEFAHHVFGSMGISLNRNAVEDVDDGDLTISMDNRFEIVQTLFAMMRILEAYHSLIHESRETVDLCNELASMLPELPDEIQAKVDELPEFDSEDKLESFFDTRYEYLKRSLTNLGVKENG